MKYEEGFETGGSKLEKYVEFMRLEGYSEWEIGWESLPKYVNHKIYNKDTHEVAVVEWTENNGPILIYHGYNSRIEHAHANEFRHGSASWIYKAGEKYETEEHLGEPFSKTIEVKEQDIFKMTILTVNAVKYVKNIPENREYVNFICTNTAAVLESRITHDTAIRLMGYLVYDGSVIRPATMCIHNNNIDITIMLDKSISYEASIDDESLENVRKALCDNKFYGIADLTNPNN